MVDSAKYMADEIDINIIIWNNMLSNHIIQQSQKEVFGGRDRVQHWKEVLKRTDVRFKC